MLRFIVVCVGLVGCAQPAGTDVAETGGGSSSTSAGELETAGLTTAEPADATTDATTDGGLASSDTLVSTGSDETSTGSPARPDPLPAAVPYLERFLAEVDDKVLADVTPNPFTAQHDLAAYYTIARTNVLLANLDVAVLTRDQEVSLLASLAVLGDFLADVEMGDNACATTVRTDFAHYFPPVPRHGWGFVSGAQSEAYAASYPECELAEPLLVEVVSADANPPLIRFGYNDGHALWALARIVRVFCAYDVESDRAERYDLLGRTVLDDWLAQHAGAPHDLPGLYYEEFHDGVDYAGHPHQRLYWAVNSNAALGRAMIEFAEIDPAGADPYWSMAASIADVWKNETTSITGGAYAWVYARSARPQDEYVEDTVHAGVSMPFIAAAFSSELGPMPATVFASDITATAAAIDLVVPPPDRDVVRARMDGQADVGPPQDLAPSDYRLVGEWAALAPALRAIDYDEAEAYLAVLDAVTSLGDTETEHPGYGYYRLTLDSYAIAALAQ
ncbi:MAG: hypothetical protein AAF721_03420 [Myxococcota bacterium]